MQMPPIRRGLPDEVRVEQDLKDALDRVQRKARDRGRGVRAELGAEVEAEETECGALLVTEVRVGHFEDTRDVR
ncbi:hypothetical protein NKH77_35310 [Streptomyces sp. M19]